MSLSAHRDDENDEIVDKSTLRIVGSFEIKELLGVRRQRAYQITSRDDFPEPVADLCGGKVWLTEEVEEWIRLHRS